MTHECGHRGFTLLELVLAATIFATIAAALYASMNVAFRGRASAYRQVDTTRHAALVLHILQQDFQSILPPGEQLSGAFIGQPPGQTIAGSDAFLEFYSLGRNPSLEGTPLEESIRRIGLVFRTDLAEPALIRQVEPNLLARVLEDPIEEVLAVNIRSITARYFDGDYWYDNWDSTLQNNELPRAVELTIEFNQPAPTDPSRLYRVTQVIPISCQGTATEQTQEEQR